MPDIGEIDWNRSLFKEILGTAIELQSAIQSGQEYMFDDEKTTSDTDAYNFMFVDGETMSEENNDGSKWVTLQFGELMGTVTLLNSVMSEKELGCTSEEIVQLAVHNYKIADSLYSALKYLFEAHASVEEKVEKYLEDNYPGKWNEYEKQCDEYDEIQEKVVKFHSFMSGKI